MKKEILDREEALKMLGGNKKLYYKILHSFYYSYKDLNLILLNKKELGPLLHNLIGLTGSIGAPKLQYMATKTKETMRDECIIEFSQELRKTLNYIKTII